jgi:D-aminoacyl-tRNA deacylase
MKVVVQRVSRANVSVEEEIKGSIDRGLLLLVGIHENDDMDTVKWVVNKVLKLRIFEDEEGKLNKSVTDVGGGVLVVSQFTLYGNVSKGTRPSFIEAAKPEIAEPLYDKMIAYFKNKSDLQIGSGVFGAMMDVELINDGPVTILIEKE